MALAVDRKRLLRFLDSIQESVTGPCANPSGVVIRGGGGRRFHHAFGDYQVSTEQLRSIYKEMLQRGGGRLVHRYERLVGGHSCLCYQNAYLPRVAFVFFHGIDGTPYDYLGTVRRFYDKLGSRLPALWVLPAGSYRSRPVSSLCDDQRDFQPDLPRSPPRASTPSAEVLDPSPTEAARTYVMSPFGPNPSVKYGDVEKALRKRVQELVDPDMTCEDIDPSGGYQWWEIPALNFITGRNKGFKMFVHALKQNLRTPKEFFAVRQNALQTLQSISSTWDIPTSQIYIGGFSQGAMLASDLLLASPSPLGGAVLLSGAPVGRSDHKQAMREHRMMRSNNANVAVAAACERAPGSPAKLSINSFSAAKADTPVFQAHGTRDPVIPFPIGKFLRKHLMSMGFTNITFESFSGAHDFPLEIADKVMAWLLTTPPVRALAYRRPEIDSELSELGPASDPSNPPGRSSMTSAPEISSSRTVVASLDSGVVLEKQGRFSFLRSKLSSLSRRRHGRPQRVAITSADSGPADDDWSATESIDNGQGLNTATSDASPTWDSPACYRASTNVVCTDASISCQDIDDAGNGTGAEDYEPFEWSQFNVKLSRLIAETLVVIKDLDRTLILPVLTEDNDATPTSPSTEGCATGRQDQKRHGSLEISDASDWPDFHRKLTRELSMGSDSGRWGVTDAASVTSRSFCLPATLRGDFDFPLKDKKQSYCATPSTLDGASPYAARLTNSPPIFTDERCKEEASEESSSDAISRHQPLETLASWCSGELSERERPANNSEDAPKYVPRNAMPRGQRTRETKEKLRHPRTWRRAKKSLGSPSASAN